MSNRFETLVANRGITNTMDNSTKSYLGALWWVDSLSKYCLLFHITCIYVCKHMCIHIHIQIHIMVLVFFVVEDVVKNNNKKIIR